MGIIKTCFFDTSALLKHYIETEKGHKKVQDIFSYKEKNIRSIVEFLYKNGDKISVSNRPLKEQADKICDTYGSRGYDFLRDLYEGYNCSGQSETLPQGEDHIIQ